MRIHVSARLDELHTPRDCRREARRLAPEALRRIGEALAQKRLAGLATPAELSLLAEIAGRRFSARANAQFKRRLEGKLFDRLWWASPFSRLNRDRQYTLRSPP